MADSQDLVPYNNRVVNPDLKLSDVWSIFFRRIQDLLFYIQKEKVLPLNNNQSSVANLTGLSFDRRYYSQAIIDYVVQRTTDSSELLQTGSLKAYYRPLSGDWSLVDRVDVKTAWTSYTPVFENMGTVTSLECSYVQDEKNLFLKGYGILGSTTPGAVSIGLPSGYTITNATTLSLVGGSLINNAAASHFVPLAQTNETKLFFGSATGGGGLSGSSGGGLGSSGNEISWTAGPIPISTGLGLAGINFSITSDGQIQYTTTNQSGTGVLSRVVFRVRQIEAKAFYSRAG